jgi:hypothetical protein
MSNPAGNYLALSQSFDTSSAWSCAMRSCRRQGRVGAVLGYRPTSTSATSSCRLLGCALSIVSVGCCVGGQGRQQRRKSADYPCGPGKRGEGTRARRRARQVRYRGTPASAAARIIRPGGVGHAWCQLRPSRRKVRRRPGSPPASCRPVMDRAGHSAREAPQGSRCIRPRLWRRPGSYHRRLDRPLAARWNAPHRYAGVSAHESGLYLLPPGRQR